MREIYFDNAATTYPKPPSVVEAVKNAVLRYGGNPGRGGHMTSQTAAEAVYKVRAKAAEMFGAEPENTVFTLNCTHALNMAMKGLIRPGDKMAISPYEHNAVARPAYALSRLGVHVEVPEAGESDGEIIEGFKKIITPEFKLCVCTAASNVTGRLMPINEIAEICGENGVPLIVDGAQACGTVPLKMSDGINILCTPGHKGLYGPTGTGLLISDGKYKLGTIIEGGTGATSGELEQTSFMPERLESGTLNTVGILGLGAGIDYVKNIGMKRIKAHEEALCGIISDGMKNAGNFKIYSRGEKSVPILSFNIEGIPAPRLAGALSEAGFALRGGLHCAYLAHKTIGTFPDGTVRFSPSAFSSERDVVSLVNYLKKICKTGL